MKAKSSLNQPFEATPHAAVRFLVEQKGHFVEDLATFVPAAMNTFYAFCAHTGGRVCFLALLLLANLSWAQTGPGGIGNATGSPGQPKVVLWLHADDVTGANGSDVLLWPDRSGNGHDFVADPAYSPTLNTGGAPLGHNSLVFSKENARMYCENFDMPSGEFSIYFSVRYLGDDSRGGLFSYATNSEPYGVLVNMVPNNMRLKVNGTAVGSEFSMGNVQFSNSNWRGGGVLWANNQSEIRTYTMGAGSPNTEVTSGSANYAQGQNIGSGGTAVIGHIQKLLNGGFVADSALNCEISEIIIYDRKLNVAQTRLAASYLHNEYNYQLQNNGFDKLNPGTGYNTAGLWNKDLVGIGRDGGSGSSHLNGAKGGIVLDADITDMTGSFTYVSAAHNGTVNSLVSSNLPIGTVQRWNRSWFLRADGGGTCNIGFDFSEGINGEFPLNADNYVLLKRSSPTGTFSVVNIPSSNKYIIDDRIYFRTPLNTLGNGEFTIGTTNQILSPLDGQPIRTFYAFNTGNWNNSARWTLDGSAAPTYINPNGDIPGVGSQVGAFVVVPSGRDITADVNGINLSAAQVNGRVRINATSGHTFGDISGNGIISYQGAGGVDNFPAGDLSGFADPNLGGTIEINGNGGFDMNVSRTVNKLNIALGNAANEIYLLSNLTLNGDITITRGTFFVGKDGVGGKRTLVSNGNVTVLGQGRIRTGNVNLGSSLANQHEWAMYRDFVVNAGASAWFTNRIEQSNLDPNDGAVNVRFLGDSRDQQCITNGITRFYRVEINKGLNDNYKVTFTADTDGDFNLFGKADFNMGENAQQANSNAFGLVAGTAELRNNIDALLHSGNDNYNINEAATIWINGGHAYNATNCNAVVPYGKIRVTTGLFEALGDGGITTRGKGTLYMEGGTATIRGFRTSVFGASNVGGIVQSGGLIDIRGLSIGPLAGGYAALALVYEDNTFIQTGGEIRITAPPANGLIFINSDPQNTNLSGGKIRVEVSNNSPNYRIASQAPLWELEIVNAGFANAVQIAALTNGPGSPDNRTIPLQPITIKSRFFLGANTTFNANNQDIFIEGDFIWSNDATYTQGTNSTRFTGPGSGTLQLGTTQKSLRRVVIDKQADDRQLAITQGLGGGALIIQDELVINRGEFDLTNRNIDLQGNATLNGNVLATAGGNTVGRLRFSGSALQTINSSGVRVDRLEINNASGVSLENGDLSIVKNLHFTVGNFDINANTLTLTESSTVFTTANASRFIVTDGSPSAGGLERLVYAPDANVVFPVGTDANADLRYTPVTMRVNGALSDSGYVRVAPVDETLELTNQSAGPDILSYYWRTGIRDFDLAVPTVSWQFTYSQNDVVGDEGLYLPGRVLDDYPFTRSSEAAGNINTGANTFAYNNGVGNNLNGGLPLVAANYTAGRLERFQGSPRVFFSRSEDFEAIWESPNNWNDADQLTNQVAPAGIGPEDWHSQAQIPSSDYPQVGDVAIIGFTHPNDGSGTPGMPHVYQTENATSATEIRFTRMTDATGNPVARYFDSFEPLRLRPTAIVSNSSLGTIKRIVGEGTLMFDNQDVSLTGIDVGDFLSEDSSIVAVRTNMGALSLTNLPIEIPNLVVGSAVNAPRGVILEDDVQVRGHVDILNYGDIRLFGASGGDLSIGGNLGIGFNAKLYFSNSVEHSCEVAGNIRLGANNALIEVLSPNATTREVHNLAVGGDIILNTNNVAASGLRFYSGAANDYIALTLTGEGEHQLINTASSPTSQLAKIVMEKGFDQSSSFTVNAPITLPAPGEVPGRLIDFRTGQLRFNNSSIDILLENSPQGVEIPMSSALQLDAGTLRVEGATSGVLLDGLLRINGGSMILDGGPGSDNYLEYSASNNARLEINGGSLYIGSQLRRQINSDGIIDYIQTGGTVTVGERSAPVISRPIFQVEAFGVNQPEFELTGGQLIVARSNNSSSVSSVIIESTNFETAGSFIQLGNANTPSGGPSNNFGVEINVPIDQLILNNSSGNNLQFKLNQSLAVRDLLQVDAGNTLACGFNVTLQGDLTVNGTLNFATGRTLFLEHNTLGTVGGTGTITLQNIDKSGTGITDFQRSVTVNGNLFLSEGDFELNANTLEMAGNLAEIDGNIFAEAPSEGLKFTGGETQSLSRSAPGASTVDILTMQKTGNRVNVVPAGGFMEFQITSALRFSGGVLNLDGNLLTLATNAEIEPVLPYNGTNMISTGGSFVQFGVRKTFPANYSQNYFVPLGQGTVYTPATFIFDNPDEGFTSGTTPTTFTISSKAGAHPIISGPTNIDNVLNYYFDVSASGVTDGVFDLEFFYDNSQVRPNANADVEYIAVQVLPSEPEDLILRFGLDRVDESLNILTYKFNGVNSDAITGSYFAGKDPNIPLQIFAYETTKSGDASEGQAPLDGGTYDSEVPGQGAPNGSRVTVVTGDTLRFDQNNITFYRTIIEPGGVVEIDATEAHNLGLVEGSGTLRLLNTGSIPAGNYVDFFTCTGGAIEFGGNQDISVMSGLPIVRKLTLSGTGERTLANNNVLICDTLVINGASTALVVDNPNDRNLTVQGELFINGGTFLSGDGDLTVEGLTTMSGGIFEAGNSGTITFESDMLLNGGSFDFGTGTSLHFKQDFIKQAAASISGGSNQARAIFDGTARQLIDGDFAGANNIHRVEIDNSAGLDIAGNLSIANEFLLTEGLVYPDETANFLLEQAAVFTPERGSHTSFVHGKVQKVKAPSSSFVFPVGKRDWLRPLTVGTSSTPGNRTWAVEYFDSSATTIPGVTLALEDSVLIRTISRQEHWIVDSQTGTNTLAKIGLSWGDSSVVSDLSIDQNKLDVLAWNPTAQYWESYGGTAHTYDGSIGSFIADDETQFTQRIFTLGSNDRANPLPVTFLQFEGEKSGTRHNLYWATATETNNDFFVLERSSDGVHYENLAYIQGAGNSVQVNQYLYADERPLPGLNYYRLRQVDFNGEQAYHPRTVILEQPEASDRQLLDILVYPNPARSGELKLRVFSSSLATGYLSVYDLSGRLIYQDVHVPAQINRDDVEVPAEFNPGLYIMEYVQGSSRMSKPFIIQ